MRLRLVAGLSLLLVAGPAQAEPLKVPLRLDYVPPKGLGCPNAEVFGTYLGRDLRYDPIDFRGKRTPQNEHTVIVRVTIEADTLRATLSLRAPGGKEIWKDSFTDPNCVELMRTASASVLFGLTPDDPIVIELPPPPSPPPAPPPSSMEPSATSAVLPPMKDAPPPPLDLRLEITGGAWVSFERTPSPGGGPFAAFGIGIGSWWISFEGRTILPILTDKAFHSRGEGEYRSVFFSATMAPCAKLEVREPLWAFGCIPLELGYRRFMSDDFEIDQPGFMTFGAGMRVGAQWDFAGNLFLRLYGELSWNTAKGSAWIEEHSTKIWEQPDKVWAIGTGFGITL